jgi:hypothetical protein
MITNLRIGYNGRFGNQLFQFASTIGIAKKLNYNVFFPKKNITNSIEQVNANGKKFLAKIDIVDCFDIDNLFFTNNLIVENNISERFFHFDEELFKIKDFTNINGYLQSEKYFIHCKDEILDILKIKKEFIDSATELLPKTNKELVAIHIRRSDYLFLEGYHSLNGVEYINRALKLIGNKEDYHFVVCSDDIEWCESIWGNDENFTLIKNGSPFIDFTVMSLCQHHIISNSSFSWWSSYLSKNENKKVIAPKNWFGSKMSNNILTDLYTKNMVII